MQRRFVSMGALWGALLGWLTAFLLFLSWTFDPLNTSGALGRTADLVVMPLLMGVPVGAASGAVCGLGSALAVGRVAVTAHALPRAFLGALVLPTAVAAIGPTWLPLVPGLVGAALLAVSVPWVVGGTGPGAGWRESRRQMPLRS